MQLPFRMITAPQPHGTRAARIIRKHPRVKHLSGRNPWTLALTCGLVTLHLTIAWLVSQAPFWVAIAVAWGFGVFLAQALYAVLHECAHHLVLPSKAANRWVARLANTPLVFPIAESYAHYHRVHHRSQGQLGVDPDLPMQFEVRLAKGIVGKLVWHTLFPVWQVIRIHHIAARPPNAKRVIMDWAIQVPLALTIVTAFGWTSLLYLVASLWFTMALHPTSARLLQEHYAVGGENQETFSYYGLGNLLALNVGYHNEHHDFPSVPWNRLPQVHAIGAAAYHPLKSHGSWFHLLMRLFRDDNFGPAQRIVRSPRPT